MDAMFQELNKSSREKCASLLLSQHFTNPCRNLSSSSLPTLPSIVSRLLVLYQFSSWLQDSCSNSIVHTHATSIGRKRERETERALLTLKHLSRLLCTLCKPELQHTLIVKVIGNEKNDQYLCNLWNQGPEVIALKPRLVEKHKYLNKCKLYHQAVAKEGSWRESLICHQLPLLGLRNVQ